MLMTMACRRRCQRKRRWESLLKNMAADDGTMLAVTPSSRSTTCFVVKHQSQTQKKIAQ
jgi:hypothetical protein